MNLVDIANFISVVGFPAFMTYYIFTKLTEEKKKTCAYEEILKKIEHVISRWEYTTAEQNKLLMKLIEKIDRILESNAVILDRLPRS